MVWLVVCGLPHSHKFELAAQICVLSQNIYSSIESQHARGDQLRSTHDLLHASQSQDQRVASSTPAIVHLP